MPHYSSASSSTPPYKLGWVVGVQVLMILGSLLLVGLAALVSAAIAGALDRPPPKR